MKYLDNLIAWGDSLFRQDTIESINEATQLYVLAANLLGRAPAAHPAARDRRAQDLRRSSRSDRASTRSATRWSSWKGSSRSTSACRDQTSDPDAERAALRHRPHALLLHPAQRQAARLLGHGRPTGCSRSATA